MLDNEPNIYEQERKKAYDRLLQQLAAKQSYGNYQTRKDLEAQRLAETRARQAAPGSREINWAGKGLAAGGPWGALAGAVGARLANAYDAKGIGGKASALFGMGDLKNALKYGGQADLDANALSGAAGQERARASDARLKRQAGQAVLQQDTSSAPPVQNNNSFEFEETGPLSMENAEATDTSTPDYLTPQQRDYMLQMNKNRGGFGTGNLR